MSGNDEDLTRLGEVIRAERERKGILQKNLSVEASLHPTYICAVENGSRNLTISSLVRIASALETKASGLLKKAGL